MSADIVARGLANLARSEAASAAKSANTQALVAAIRSYGFFPQPLTRTPAADIPTASVGVAGAVSAINARAAGNPLVLMSDNKVKWLAGPALFSAGTGTWYPRGPWVGSRGIGGFAAFEFVHTGTDLELSLIGTMSAAAGNLRVLVGDRIAAVVTVPMSTGAWYYVRLTFPSSATRRIRIEGAAGAYRGVNVTSAGELTPVGRNYPLIALLGDSFAEGTGATTAMDGEAVALARALGGNAANYPVGGTGLLNPSTGGKVAWTHATRMTDLTLAGVTDTIGGATTPPALGIVMASLNDYAAGSSLWNGAADYPAAIKKAAFTLIDAWIAANPGRPLLLFGPTSTVETPALGLLRMRDALQEACWGAARDNVWFIDRFGPGALLREGARAYTATTGTTTNGSAIVTALGSTSGIAATSVVSAPGIPTNAEVLSVDSASQVTLSHAATASASGVSLLFRNDATAHYTSLAFGDTTHPSQEGHNLDALWMAREARRLILNELA